MAKQTNKPAWLIPKKASKLKSMSTRNVVKRHLKEWNKDEDEEEEYKQDIEDLKTTLHNKKAEFKEWKRDNK